MQIYIAELTGMYPGDKSHSPGKKQALHCGIMLFMQKKILFVTALLLLFSYTELHELSRLPQLVKHFGQHRITNPSLSVAGFLQLHYQNNHPDDRDDNDDSQLPFKSGFDFISIDITNSVHRETELLLYIPGSGKLSSFYSEGKLCKSISSIFRPPRC